MGKAGQKCSRQPGSVCPSEQLNGAVPVRPVVQSSGNRKGRLKMRGSGDLGHVHLHSASIQRVPEFSSMPMTCQDQEHPSE